MLTIIYSSVFDPLESRAFTESLLANSSMELTEVLKIGIDKTEVKVAVK